ncbi:rhodanese-like domain-containing protein [Salipaludibacillus daqingensis]|uniref:rhodanese-like domain-containing protein n=1 Tax=Salipaludibacillus daqingensis TaxID=3041001 RepID=UPI002473E015|nr:rhodanese-like domain-containing protein [Salipaludibacillus daqingensis]
MSWVLLAFAIIAVVILVKKMRPVSGVEQISTTELKDKMIQDKNAHYLDVREPNEFTSGHVKGMKNVPMSQLSSQIEKLSQEKEMVLMCRSGSRSVMAANKLKKAGFDRVTNVRGGMNQWDGPVKTGAK